MGGDFQLYGTAEPPTVRQNLCHGPLSVAIEAGEIRSIRWHSIELVRGITYPIRDKNWGTLPLRTVRETLDPEGALYLRQFESADGATTGTLALSASAEGGLDVTLSLVMQRDLSVNRAGFTLLHPIAGQVGAPLEITHSDGSRENSAFPALISPAQPVRDIRGLCYGLDGARVEIAMDGEVFEMEDQRNWSDASYKTYCRPLSRPYPFRLEAGTKIEQRLTLRFSGTVAAAKSKAQSGALRLEDNVAPLPEILLAVQPGWEASSAPPLLPEVRRLVRIDLRQDAIGADLQRCLAGSTGPYDLEVVTTDTASDLLAQMEQLKAGIDALGRTPGHLLALPAAYLASYQPDGPWPGGATPAQALAAARAGFPDVAIGGGMLTNFTELNRHRPDPAAIDYLGHGSTAIVHAADDQSVIETIEALPQIFHSARHLAPGKPYRLGLVSIGARSNPYGAAVTPNPDGLRLALAQEDPRATALFGAAWLLGVAAATEDEPVDAIALGAPAGPFGLRAPDGRLRPSFHVVRALAAMRSATRWRLRLPDPALRGVAVANGSSTSLIVANLSADPRPLSLPGTAAIRCLDTESMDEAAEDLDWLLTGPVARRASVNLPPFALAFIKLED